MKRTMLVEALKNSRHLDRLRATGAFLGRTEVRTTSEAELLDEALARVARLEAALAITGGTIHDVNNLLTVLSGNLYLLTESVRMRKSLYEKVRSARNSAEKCSTLMRELLTFSRDPDDDNQIICPGNHVTALKPLLQRALSSEQRIEVLVGGKPWSVTASAAQFESAVTNLVINARDSLSANGSIRLHAENVTIDAALANELRVSRGDHICVRITDNGAGIPVEILPRIFDPLFTTKRSGHGTGLGLNMVQRFAHLSHGALSIESIEGQGTTVRMWLPRSEEQAELTANMTLPLSTLTGGDETVILVSKDEAARAAVQDILQALGYTVVLAALGKVDRQAWKSDSTSLILVCERSLRNRNVERRWIESLRRSNPGMRHVAVLAPNSSPTDVAPDADAYLYRPIAVFDLARVMRAAVEEQ